MVGDVWPASMRTSEGTADVVQIRRRGMDMDPPAAYFRRVNDVATQSHPRGHADALQVVVGYLADSTTAALRRVRPVVPVSGGVTPSRVLGVPGGVETRLF